LKKLAKWIIYFNKIIIQFICIHNIFFGKFFIFSLLSCLVLASVPAGLCRSSAPVIYVAGDGSGDFNCDGKADQVEINQALQFVAENSEYTTVHLKGPFTYTINSTIYVGSNTILEGDSNAVVKLVDHAGWTNNPMIPLIGQRDSVYTISNVTVRGFEINGDHENNTETPDGKGYYNMIFFKHINGLKVYGMYLHDSHGDGLRVYYGENIKFYNNRVSLLGHDGFYVINGQNIEAWNNRITCRINSALRARDSNNVRFHDNVIDAYPDAGPGIQVERSTGKMNDIEICDNVITNSWGPGIWVIGTVGEYDQNLSDCHIHHNTFIGSGANRNIEWVGGVLGSGFHNVLIENNVFDGVYNAAVVNMYMSDVNSGPLGTGFTTTVRNNIIINTVPRNTNGKNTGYGVSNCLPKSHTIVLQNNCLYNNKAGNYKNCASTTDIYADPLFADRINHDYHLQSTAGRWDGEAWVKDKVSSPCIDAGYPSSDFSNEPIPNGKQINIGRYGNTIYASKSKVILPTASFSINVTRGYAPLSVQFIGLSQNATEWKWDFGDGLSSVQQNPVHTYLKAGDYNVILTSSNENGTDSKTVSIRVLENEQILTVSGSIYNNRLREASPETVFSSSSFLDIGGMKGVGRYRDVMWFDLSGYTGVEQIHSATLSLLWYYPSIPRINDTIIEIYRPASSWSSDYVSWNKKSKGIAWNNSGGDWYDKNGVLQGSTPYSTITMKASDLPNKYCELNVTDLVREYVSSKYSNTGFFIKARNENDNYVAFYNDECKLYISTPILPTAIYSSNVTGGYAPLFVQFKDLSQNATEWKWDFGDGASSTLKNPVHGYLAAGNYKVTLTVSNSNGIDATTAMINVSEKEKISIIAGSTYDNRLREASPETVISSSSFLDIGGMNGVGRYRDVMWFDLSGYTGVEQIHSATLSLLWYYPSSPRIKDTIIEIYRPASSWSSDYISWNKKSKGIAWNNPGGDWYDKNGVLQGSTPYATLTLKAGDLPNKYCELNVTDLVREYVSSKYSNTGFLIKARTENDNYIAFYSTDCGNMSQVPEMRLSYF
jgi:PKD repeat protein